jgi:spore coat protein A
VPVATKHTIPFAGQQTDLYNLVATQFSQTMHPDLPGKTNFFGYSDLFTLDRKYLGGIIVAKRGTPVVLTVTNLIPPKHVLPVDGSIMAGPNQMTMDLPINRIAVHLHGGLTPWFSDGTPFPVGHPHRYARPKLHERARISCAAWNHCQLLSQ